MPMMMGRKRPKDVGMKLAMTTAIFSMMPLLLRTPRKTPAHRMVEAMLRPAEAWLLMMELCSFLPR